MLDNIAARVFIAPETADEWVDPEIEEIRIEEEMHLESFPGRRIEQLSGAIEEAAQSLEDELSYLVAGENSVPVDVVKKRIADLRQALANDWEIAKEQMEARQQHAA